MTIAVEGTPAPTPEKPAFDFKSLIESTPEDAVQIAAETPESEAKVTEETSGASQEKAVEPSTNDTEKPNGTPDVERQKLDQRFSSIDDRLAKLMDAVEAQGGKPTPKQAEKIVELKDERDEIAEMLTEGREIDPWKDTKTLAKRVQDSEKRAREEVSELRNTVEELKAERIWDKETRRFEGVDVQDVWKKAVTDATVEVGEEIAASGQEYTDKQVRGLCAARATKLYEKRCDEAHKSIKAKSEVPKKETAPAARIAPPKATPGGARVTTGIRSPAAASPTSDRTALYAALIKPD